MDNNRIEYERSIYTVWDLFGDIGGLFDLLFYFANWLIGLSSIVSGSSLNRYIFARLFKLNRINSSKSVKESDKKNPLKSLLNLRKPALFDFGGWLLYCRRDRKIKVLYSQACDQVGY